MSSDPWTSFLEWLTTVVVPAWGELIALLPYVIVGTIAVSYTHLRAHETYEGISVCVLWF